MVSPVLAWMMWTPGSVALPVSSSASGVRGAHVGAAGAPEEGELVAAGAASGVLGEPGDEQAEIAIAAEPISPVIFQAFRIGPLLSTATTCRRRRPNYTVRGSGVPGSPT